MICSCRFLHDKYNTWDIVVRRTLILYYLPTEDANPFAFPDCLRFVFTYFGGHKVFNERTRLQEGNKTENLL